ncbi:phosphonate C-P lyase system protein PhnK [Pseudodesulfovibrio piezophilus]|uniref:Phosphonates transport ATP-binding protein phnK n=1 Tax=Pseudodesulfovibrio piezophilus (strain DSM 21447 / JCM 15486 / C1TLV30) TaxID=1322246 RepID=M1WQW2_PSEP2|nr:phosphonate C-P lyase system protein PhnK [Pseudodesulfovibrio piezophilus]CCH47912.1 Phosphonates transport ATP-binding protein phnK [Pseudodesulfovibrio piezophilus C1TLV30]
MFKRPHPLITTSGLSKSYGEMIGCHNIDLELWPGEVLGIVGESGSGKSTLLGCLSGKLSPTSGKIEYQSTEFGLIDIHSVIEPIRRKLMRTEWGVVHQNPRDGLRLGVTAGANIGERLMSTGLRNYSKIRSKALYWMREVELETDRIDHFPREFSGGMQQRLQIACNLVTSPKLIFMDEPTGGLDVSVQARLLDLLRDLVTRLGLSVVIVTHDLAVARLLAHRLMVMKKGEVVETGLADQVLDDPQHPYTQLLVSSILQA